MIFGTFILMCIAIGAANSHDDLVKEWNDYKGTFNKHYGPVEELRRMSLFATELKEIQEFNSQPHPYKQGLNMFSDWTEEEKLGTISVGISPKNFSVELASAGFLVLEKAPVYKFAAPEEKDWREEGMVTRVKSQGACGSCWAFSAIASLESIQAIQGKVSELTELSEQHLVDCFKKNCEGEYVREAFKYIKKNGGVTKAECYPYKSQDGKARTCQAKKNCYSGKIRGMQIMNNEEDLKNAIANVGPVSVQTCWPKSLARYKSGVYSSADCSDQSVCRNRQHATTAVGYGSSDEGDFWIIKNSHDESYGDQGYYKLKRGTNECAVGDSPVYPIV